MDCARETRKYGLGWLFISQFVASLDLGPAPDEVVLLRLRTFLGRGAQGAGGTRGTGRAPQPLPKLQRPQTSVIMGEKQYSFMVHGPVSPLSVSGGPMFFNALNYHTEFPVINGIV